MDEGLAWPLRVRAWDAALASVRGYLRGEGLREVSTRVRVEAVALEPWIEPIASADRWLATSPELEMKRLLAEGSGSIFQIAHVFRSAERGARHSEEFHLIEWYRVAEAGEARGSSAYVEVIADVEAVVAAVFEAVFEAVGQELGLARPARLAWRRVPLLELMSETLGASLAGDEDAAALAPLLARVRSEGGLGLGPGAASPQDHELAALLAWTELFSLWSDLYLDPWLEARGSIGVHVLDFPRYLAALAEHRGDGKSAARFESHVRGVELANGYRELRDPDEQGRRFERVAAMRRLYGQRELPQPRRFIEVLDRLPPCAGVALGLDRLIALACGRQRLDAIAL